MLVLLQLQPLRPLPQLTLSSSTRDENIAVVGRLGAPYGVQGWQHCQSFTKPAENILRYSLLIQPSTEKQSSGAAQGITPASGNWRMRGGLQIKRHKNAFIVKLKTVHDRDVARQYSGWLLGANPSDFVPPQNDEVFWHDLVGVEVTNVEGALFGNVISLTETGNHDVLVIRANNGKERLIPFADQYINQLDLAKRQLIVDWQADW